MTLFFISNIMIISLITLGWIIVGTLTVLIINWIEEIPDEDIVLIVGIFIIVWPAIWLLGLCIGCLYILSLPFRTILYIKEKIRNKNKVYYV